MPSSMFAGNFKDTFKLIPVHGLLAPLAGVGTPRCTAKSAAPRTFRKNIYQMAGGLLSAVAIRHRLPGPS